MIVSTLKLRRRKQLGRYDTPQPLSAAIVTWAVRSPTWQILEPSSGSGIFVHNAISRLRRLGQLHPERNVWSCDIDAGACAQTKKASHLDLERILHGDFLSFAGKAGVCGKKFDCIVGNPPYVSLHRMSKRQRKSAWDASSRLGIKINKKASLWAYFLAAAACALKEAGNLAMILPETALHADYARGLLKTLANSFSRCVYLSIRERCFLNDGAEERVVVFLGERFRSTPKETEIELHECASADLAGRFLDSLAINTSRPFPRLNGHAVPHLLSVTPCLGINLSEVKESHPLSTFLDVKIGVVTGANDFYLLTDAQRKTARIPESALVPILPRFRSCGGLCFGRKDWENLKAQGRPCWMLTPATLETRKSVLRYLRQFPRKMRDNNRTFAKRSPWYLPQVGQRPHGFLRYMGTSGPRLALVGFNVTCTNSIHRVYFTTGDKTRIRMLALSIHSSFSQLSAEFEGRAYGSGVLKLEPSEAKRIRVLIPDSLDQVRVAKCYAEAEKAMLKGEMHRATAIIDKWLYESIPTLKTILPLEALQKLLKTAIARRVGKRKIIGGVAGHSNSSINSASHLRSSRARNENDQKTEPEFASLQPLRC